MRLAVIVVLSLMLPAGVLATEPEEQVNYFPTVMFGHILEGSDASRYATTLIVRSRKATRAHIDVFNEQSEPMTASFVDQAGSIAATTTSFTFVLEPNRSVQVKLALTAEEESEAIAVKTGWATVSSLETLDASILILVATPEGRVLTRQVYSAQRSMRS